MEQKTNKMYLWLLGCLTVLGLTFTACEPGGGNDNSRTREQQQQAYQQVRGSYAGKTYYQRWSATDKKYVSDSSDVKWEILTDSTLTIKNFPMSLFADYVNDNALKEALKSAPNQDITCFTGYYNLSPVGFLLNPKTAVFELNYNKGSHKISIAFAGNSNYSFGFSKVKSVVAMQIIALSLQVDAMSENKLKGNVGFIFRGKTGVAPTPSPRK